MREIDVKAITLDSRPALDRFGSWLARPINLRKFLFWVLAFCVIFPAFWLPTFLFLVMLWLWYGWVERTLFLPIRYPQNMGGSDPSVTSPDKKNPNIMRPGPAAGMLYLGNNREPREPQHEVWESNSDCRMHHLVMGATGSGKTEYLLSLCWNFLAMGSGYFYSDGKAQNDLYTKSWSICRRLGRDDDILVINLMTGGVDPFLRQKSTEKESNSFNPFFDAPPDFLSQLLQSLLPKAGGDGATWQQKSIAMMDAVLRALAFLRSTGELEISVQTIRDYIALPKLIELYLRGERGELPEDAYLPIKSYLETGISIDVKKAREGKAQPEEVQNQHGYRTGQFVPTLAMLADTYGHIFKDRYAEVDITDAVLSNRIVIVMIPTMEKSEQEAANLGKLAVAAIKLMMAKNLGNKLEGYYRDIIESRPTNTNAPYNVTMDELGYYFAPGIDLMFAQGRSLGFMLTAAGQDFQAMAKGENKNPVESMIANTKTKTALGLEDPKETFEIFEKAGGEAYFSQVSGYQGSVSGIFGSNWKNMLSASIEKRSRVTIRELRSLKNGEAVTLFMDKLIRHNTFYLFGTAKEARKVKTRVCRFLQVESVRFEEIQTLCERVKEIGGTQGNDRVLTILRRIRGGNVQVKAPQSHVIKAIVEAQEGIEHLGAVEQGIVMYQAAIRAMKENVEPSGEVAAGGGSLPNNPNRPSAASGEALDKGGDKGVAEVRMDALKAIPLDMEFDALSFLDGPPAVTVDKHGEPIIQAGSEPETLYPVEEKPAPEIVNPPESIRFVSEVREKIAEIERAFGTESPDSAIKEIEELVTQKIAAPMATPATEGKEDPEPDIDGILAEMEKTLSSR